ncbi:hypothetical protein [Zhongshania borealis]|uniref:Uncharacterized protein n=1 Tax=Zhongshania borealis TaxID=889488 RepID=A0ABP7WC47_9GAMM
MMSTKQNVNDMIEKLREQRDDINVKIHLANMEVRDEWQELEQKWGQLVDKTKRLNKEVEPAVESVHAAISLLGEEIKEGYRKVKRAL